MTAPETETPRTDDRCRKDGHPGIPAEFIRADFARTLERELAEAKRDNISLLDLIHKIRVASGDPHGKLMLDELAPHVTKLRAELDGAKKDQERLQWLSNRGFAWRGCYVEGWQEGEWLYGVVAGLDRLDREVFPPAPESELEPMTEGGES